MAAPMFHAWGFSNFAIGMALGSTFILRRRFDPEQCLADIAEHGCDVLVVVPVMLLTVDSTTLGVAIFTIDIPGVISVALAT